MMDLVNAPNEDVTNMVVAQRMSEGNAAQVDDYKSKVDELFTKVDKLEQRVNEIEQFYSDIKLKEPNTSRGASIIKDKEKEKQIPSMKKLQQDSSRREAAASKRMQELMRQFGSIFRQITQHKWAWPFMQPVDVEGLGLYDYYQIIDRPMDFSTIKNQMEAKDGTGYKHVREICSDMRLVFKNAMKYNDEKSDVHVMAKTLLEKFEEKWLHFLPKVTEEKRKLGVALAKLCPEDLTKALEIVAQNNLNFQATAEEVELDINAQSESTLWRLKFFVKDVLKKGSSKDDNNNITSTHKDDNNIVSKRKREICDALAKTAKKRNKKPSS
ncbi:hypothetical protein CDL12_19983 [Handroanthus impetiginosus]|uniref:Uncharacterized protein n=1 Tax=Handroanthus impetiginosus TaxID=429701 RepID=A0A2G9GQA3_9LAMI|nr:hypothetical protein CDL12_19983 [Handroanthus impetiginosus]